MTSEESVCPSRVQVRVLVLVHDAVDDGTNLTTPLRDLRQLLEPEAGDVPRRRRRFLLIVIVVYALIEVTILRLHKRPCRSRRIMYLLVSISIGTRQGRSRRKRC